MVLVTAGVLALGALGVAATSFFAGRSSKESITVQEGGTVTTDFLGIGKAAQGPVGIGLLIGVAVVALLIFNK